jgi:hypothetical protein
MQRTNCFLPGILISLALLSFGCATGQTAPDPKAPSISFRDFTPTPLGENNGYAVLKYGQGYRLTATVVKRDAPLVRVYRRLNYSVNNHSWHTTNFNPAQLNGSDCCGAVWTNWYWGVENGITAPPGVTDWRLVLEIWVVDAEGRESNHLSVPAVVEGYYHK